MAGICRLNQVANEYRADTKFEVWFTYGVTGPPYAADRVTQDRKMSRALAGLA